MKKRFVAVLLSALFSVLLLTGCGGDFFMTDAEFTRMINRELAESGNSIQLTYDSSLGAKAKTVLNVYIATNDVDAALKASGLDDDHYYMVAADYPFESFSKSATYISSQVLYYMVNGQVGKRVGYATITFKNGNTQIIALVATY
mgnify:FL=1